MAESSPHTRVSRSRRAIALMAWGLLIVTAVCLWDARQTGSLTIGANPIHASLLAAFGAFVAVFAWMLFNANRRRSTDSFAAAAATLFPPPIIAFCLISSDSPLRWWMAFGIAMLVVIAILSHVPDEFFGVPRGRSSYVVPLPVFDRMERGVLDPNASWFTFNDLSKVVSDTERPSLAPRAYLNRESETRSTGASAAAYGTSRPISSVDDILGSDYDIGLLDDSLMDFDLDNPPIPSYDSPVRSPSPRTRPTTATPQRFQSTTAAPAGRSTPVLPTAYQFNPVSGHLEAAAGKRRQQARIANFRHRMERREKHASSLRQEASADRHSVLQQPPSAPTTKRATQHTDPDALSVSGRPTNLANPVSQTFTDRPPVNRSSTDERYRSTDSARDRQPPTYRSEATPVEPTRSVTPAAATQNTYMSGRTASQSAEAATSYFQETNQNRADRYRARNEAAATRFQSTSNTDAVKDPTPQSRTESQPVSRQADVKPEAARRSGSIFGVPLPFGIGSTAAEPETQQQAAPESVQRSSNRVVSETPEYPSSSPKIVNDFDDLDTTARGFRSSPSVEQSEPSAPARQQQQRRSRYEEQPTSVAPPRQQAPATTAAASVTQPAAEKLPSATHFERTKDEHGSELVEGVMTIRFDKGQKRANLHIPFSPPLPGMPEVECECVGDVPLRLKVPVRQSYGIRIEARRTNADEALDADVGFAAVYTPE